MLKMKRKHGKTYFEMPKMSPIALLGLYGQAVSDIQTDEIALFESSIAKKADLEFLEIAWDGYADGLAGSWN